MADDLRELSDVMIDLGYSRDYSPSDAAWFVHKDGHQVRVVPMPDGMKGSWWEVFPPNLVGETRAGHGSDRLRAALLGAQEPPNAFKPRYQTEAMSPDTPGDPDITRGDNAFLVVQTSVRPVERYEVREVGSIYPRLVGHDPATGEWRDFSADATRESGDHRYIEVVQRWVDAGRPALPNDAALPDRKPPMSGTLDF